MAMEAYSNKTISQLEINGVIYDITDATTRRTVSDLESFILNAFPNKDTLSTNYIPNLSATKITKDKLNVERIPDLNVNQITSGVFDSKYIPNLDARKITTGTLPIPRGGTGSTGVAFIDTDIAIAKPGCTVNKNSKYYQWGKIAYIVLSITTNQKKTTDDVLAEVTIGKRPVTTAILISSFEQDPSCSLYEDGEVKLKGTLEANKTLVVIGTYLLSDKIT